MNRQQRNQMNVIKFLINVLQQIKILILKMEVRKGDPIYQFRLRSNQKANKQILDKKYNANTKSTYQIKIVDECCQYNDDQQNPCAQEPFSFQINNNVPKQQQQTQQTSQFACTIKKNTVRANSYLEAHEQSLERLMGFKSSYQQESSYLKIYQPQFYQKRNQSQYLTPLFNSLHKQRRVKNQIKSRLQQFMIDLETKQDDQIQDQAIQSFGTFLESLFQDNSCFIHKKKSNLKRMIQERIKVKSNTKLADLYFKQASSLEKRKISTNLNSTKNSSSMSYFLNTSIQKNFFQYCPKKQRIDRQIITQSNKKIKVSIQKIGRQLSIQRIKNQQRKLKVQK